MLADLALVGACAGTQLMKVMLAVLRLMLERAAADALWFGVSGGPWQLLLVMLAVSVERVAADAHDC